MDTKSRKSYAGHIIRQLNREEGRKQGIEGLVNNKCMTLKERIEQGACSADQRPTLLS